MMKLQYLKDKHGNLVYPKPMYVECNGQQVEIQQMPLYVYMPTTLEEDHKERLGANAIETEHE